MRVPSFIEYIQQAAELNLEINIELKATVSNAETLAKQVTLGLKAYWLDYLPKPLISSFSSVCLQAMRKEGDHFFLGYIFNNWPRKWQVLWEIHQCVSIHLNYKKLNPERMKAIKQASYYLFVYTVNHHADVARSLFAQGLDAVFSDNPCLLEANE